MFPDFSVYLHINSCILLCSLLPPYFMSFKFKFSFSDVLPFLLFLTISFTFVGLVVLLQFVSTSVIVCNSLFFLFYCYLLKILPSHLFYFVSISPFSFLTVALHILFFFCLVIFQSTFLEFLFFPPLQFPLVFFQSINVQNYLYPWRSLYGQSMVYTFFRALTLTRNHLCLR